MALSRDATLIAHDGAASGSQPLHRRKRLRLALLMSLLLLFGAGALFWARKQRLQRFPGTWQQPLAEAMALIAVHAEDAGDPRALGDGAARGMVLATADVHSRYFDPFELRRVVDDFQGHFGGIGFRFLDRGAGRWEVTVVFRNGPGAQAGLRNGDLLLEVDGRPLGSFRRGELSPALRGPIGTRVNLLVYRPETGTQHGLQVVRGEVELPSVLAVRQVAPGIGYLWITSFNQRSDQQLDAAMARLDIAQLRALIIDLRGNPGGVTGPARRLADRFLVGGTIFRVRDRQREVAIDAEPTAACGTLPLALLVDRHTASSAELLAGALHDRQRALLLGERTYGKASVQQLLPLLNGGGVKLTVARAISAAGRDVDRTAHQRGGIDPDIPLPLSDSQRDALAEHQRQLEAAEHGTIPPYWHDRASADPQLDWTLAVLRGERVSTPLGRPPAR